MDHNEEHAKEYVALLERATMLNIAAIIRQAQEVERAAGRPINPNMGFGEALRILGFDFEEG